MVPEITEVRRAAGLDLTNFGVLAYVQPQNKNHRSRSPVAILRPGMSIELTFRGGTLEVGQPA